MREEKKENILSFFLLSLEKILLFYLVFLSVLTFDLFLFNTLISTVVPHFSLSVLDGRTNDTHSFRYFYFIPFYLTVLLFFLFGLKDNKNGNRKILIIRSHALLCPACPRHASPVSPRRKETVLLL